MGSFDKCDGYVALVKCKTNAAVVTTVRGAEVSAFSLQDMRRRVEESNFRQKVLEFDMVYEEGLIIIYAIIDALVHTTDFIEKVLNEFVGLIRRSGVINDPIVSHIKVPVRQPFPV